MRRIVAITVSCLAFMSMWTGRSSASWVSNNCFQDNRTVDRLKRIDARAYADVAKNEGYEFGGGCWDNDEHDDTPGVPDSGGEGPDCSGFVFKTWELRATEGLEGFRWYNKLENIHGPYASSEFHSPVRDDPFFKLASKSRDSTVYMDAFARDGHIGMLYTNIATGNGLDYIIEARGDAYGTNKFEEPYRFDSDYVAVRRGAWTADCYPNCAPPPDQVLVLEPR